MICARGIYWIDMKICAEREREMYNYSQKMQEEGD